MEKNSIILGICGKARVGKDVFAEMLADELYELTRSRFILMAYAQELKLRVQKDFDLRYEQLWGSEKEVEDNRYIKENGLFWTGREILQSYGQFFRSIDNNFWVNNLFKVIEDKSYNRVIITDVRYPNEAEPVKAAGGFIIKVISNRENIQQIHGQSHISETAMDDYDDIDLTIKNDFGLEELRAAAKDAATYILTIKKMSAEANNG